jgi:hypothetical protein
VDACEGRDARFLASQVDFERVVRRQRLQRAVRIGGLLFIVQG